MANVVGRIASALAWFSAWLFFLIGVMLTFEVVARYFFNAPTIWAEELSRLFMIWAVFIASGTLLRWDEHIRVTVVINMLPEAVRRLLRVVCLTFVAIIAGFVAWHGIPIALQSFEVGRTTGSMLGIPQWWWQASVPVGFGLISLQALASAVKVLLGGPEPAPPEGLRHAEASPD